MAGNNLPTQVPSPNTSPASSELAYIVASPYSSPSDDAATLGNIVTKAHGLSNTPALGISSGVMGAASTTGSGNVVLATSPTLVTPALGTPSAIVLTNATGAPTWNQNTTGKSAATDALNSATTVVNVASATAPTSGQVLTATSGTAATWQTLSGGGNMNTSTYDPAGIAQQVVGTTATQTLTNKTLTSGTNTFPTFNQNTTGTAANLSGTPALPNGTTATTQTVSDNSTLLATDAFVQAALPTALPPNGSAGGDLTGTYPNPTLAVNRWMVLNPTGTKTANYNASAYDEVNCDCSGGTFTVTLPTAPADKTLVSIISIKAQGLNHVTVATGGSDVINIAGVTSDSLLGVGDAKLYQYASGTAIWERINNVPFNTLATFISAYYQSITFI